MTKEDKNVLLEDFKSYKDKGACLFGVTAGSFGEGIDLPGDFLKGVIVVGLPLERPTLEVRGLIDYYDMKMEEEGVFFNIVELGGTVGKYDRIKRLVPLFQKGRLIIPSWRKEL